MIDGPRCTYPDCPEQQDALAEFYQHHTDGTVYPEHPHFRMSRNLLLFLRHLQQQVNRTGEPIALEICEYD